MLRDELARRALVLARRDGLRYERSSGPGQAVLMGTEAGRHGNFHDGSFAAIQARPSWASRLGKVHTAWKRERVLANWRWMELDSVNSSDALLMNIFCHPEVTTASGLNREVASLLGVTETGIPRFGVRPGVPLIDSRFDRTEIDMHVGDLFVEAKLTESGFQQAKLKTLERYLDLSRVFEVCRLPWTPTGVVNGYQLIRNVLAAYSSESSFCVMLDSRRGDLVETWYSVMAAVKIPSLACQLKLLTWQELAQVLPHDLRQFLEAKYGITGRVA